MDASDPAANLDLIFSQLDDRARTDPRLERYRVPPGGPSAVDAVPDGWLVSDTITRIAEFGGWWPGPWHFPQSDGDVESMLSLPDDPPDDPGVRWLGVGSIWEADFFFTPALRHPMADAPLCGISTQSLWLSLVFPTEAALLEAFLVTYDEMGLDEQGMIDEDFVEWVTWPPVNAPPEADSVHRRLLDLSRNRWSTSHPCWLDSVMPFLGDPEDWPQEAVRAALRARSPRPSPLSDRDL